MKNNLSIKFEKISPQSFQNETIKYGFYNSPFGLALIMIYKKYLIGLGFADNKTKTLADMKNRLPRAHYSQNEKIIKKYAPTIFGKTKKPLPIVLVGTDFQLAVWKVLLKIAKGKTSTYAAVAKKINKPKAARAVGAAVGRNPIAFIVPCHRIIGASSKLVGYHWGLARKQAMLEWEQG